MGIFIGFLVAVVPSCAGPCNANTCAGCCTSAGKCVGKPDNLSDATCGAQAKSCVDCTSTHQTCSSATYTCQGAAGGGSGGNCLGCLNRAGDCAPGVTDAVCGSGGVACMACTNGTSCVDGSCVTGGDGGPTGGGGGSIGPAVGAACANDSQCDLSLTATDQKYSIRGFCKKASITDPTLSAGFSYPGGYCTKRCGFENASCGAGNTCLISLGFIGEFENQCMTSCTSSSQCRAGYGCFSMGSNLSVCLPLTEDGGLLPVVDAGPGVPSEAGSACTDDAQCIPPSTGFCFRETRSDGGPSGFTGGACSADCTALAATRAADAWCGNAGVCNSYGFATGDGLGPVVVWLCDHGCGVGWDAGCRSGYVCDQTSVESPACVPNCHNAGVQCPTGTSCRESGICQ